MPKKLMSPDVARLATDSGELAAIRGQTDATGERLVALDLAFASGTLRLRCDGDTDEVLVEVADEPGSYPPLRNDALDGLLGMTIEYAWVMTNQRGYSDAFQLRLRDGRGREEIRQFEVGASAIDVRRIG